MTGTHNTAEFFNEIGDAADAVPLPDFILITLDSKTNTTPKNRTSTSFDHQYDE